jgi:hypothetical protein
MQLLSAAGPILPPNPPAPELIVPLTIIFALFVLVVVSSKLRRRLHRGPHGKNSRAGLSGLEETGIIDMAAFYMVIVFFIYGLYLESAISAFAFGIANVYFLDHAASFIHRKKLRHVRSKGVMRYIEELGVLEAALILAAIYMFHLGSYPYAILLSWVFGMLFAVMVDRARLRSKIHL